MKFKINDERLARLLIKEINKIESGDVSDIYHYIRLVIANEAEIVEQLDDTTWKVSNKFNAKKCKYRNVGFRHTFTNYEYVDFINEDGEEDYEEIETTETKDLVHTYVIDGNGYKVIATQSDNINLVEYKHVEIDEIKDELSKIKENCLSILPQSDCYIELPTEYSQLIEDYSDKAYRIAVPFCRQNCYDLKELYIPKSLTLVNGAGKFLVKDWFYQKNAKFFMR